MIERAQRRGELPTELDATRALELVVASLPFRAMLTHRPNDEQAITDIVDALLTGLARHS